MMLVNIWSAEIIMDIFDNIWNMGTMGIIARHNGNISKCLVKIVNVKPEWHYRHFLIMGILDILNIIGMPNDR